MLMWFWMACTGGEPEPSDNEEEAATVVHVQSVEPNAVVDRLQTTAVVESERAADLLPISPGTVLSIQADEGDEVRRGQVLATLESVSLQAGTQRTRAEVSRLKAQVGDMERLYAQGAVSQRDLEDMQYQLKAARTNASEASRNFGQTRLTAPFDGVVAKRDARVGQLASGTVLFQVVDLTDLQVRVDLPERDVGRVRPGQTVRLISAYDTEVTGRGVIERVAPVIDAGTGTFRVTVDVLESALRPGQYVKVAIEVDRHADVPTVPRKAVLWEDGRPFVYVDEEGKAVRKPLSVGLMDDDRVEILSGVELGDNVITLGQSNLKEGASVRTAVANATAEKGE